MNKFYLSIIVLLISVHSTGLGMLTVSKMQPRVATKCFTQEKIEKDELLRAVEESRVFLGLFGQHSLNKTGNMFCDLALKAKKKVLPFLSHNQKVLLWCGINDVEIPFLSAVFNGNEKVALMYSQKPIGEILEAYASAKEMMKWCPDLERAFKEQHYMALKNSQIRIFLDAEKEHFVHSSDVPQFIRALDILDDIDPKFLYERKKITDMIKLYPSLTERLHVFYNLIPNDSLKQSFLGSLVCAGVGAPSTLGVVKMLGNCVPMLEFMGFVAAVIVPASMGGYWIGLSGALYYYNYQPNLKNNVLPNQPTLTDYLKKTAL